MKRDRQQIDYRQYLSSRQRDAISIIPVMISPIILVMNSVIHIDPRNNWVTHLAILFALYLVTLIIG